MNLQSLKVLLGSRITYIEPMIRLISGSVFLVVALGILFYPGLNALWLGLAFFFAIGLLGSGSTQFCLMAWTLRRIGFRSEWDDLKALERSHAIAQTRASYLETLNLLNVVIVEMAPDGRLLWKSDKWAELFDVDENLDFHQCISNESVDIFNNMVSELIEGKDPHATVHLHGCGQESRNRWLEGRFIKSLDSEGSLVLRGVFRDVTETHKENLSNAHRAMHDRLTGLPNRALFDNILDQAKARADRNSTALSVLFVDLDNFKQVNDQMGHHIGDKVLISVATALRDGIRPSDTASRWGGDEFVVLIPDMKILDTSRIVAEGLLEKARSKRLGDDAQIVTFSIGVATYPSDAQNISDLLVKADEALYLAKSLGRDNVQFASHPQGVPVKQCRLDLNADFMS